MRTSDRTTNSGMSDIITLLDLACIKYTGIPLPRSATEDNNWRYILYDNHNKRAVFHPCPNFNPLAEWRPPADFIHQVLRKNLVRELNEVWNRTEIMLKELDVFRKKWKLSFAFIEAAVPSSSLLTPTEGITERERKLHKIVDTQRYRHNFSSGERGIVIKIDCSIISACSYNYRDEFRSFLNQDYSLRKQASSVMIMYDYELFLIGKSINYRRGDRGSYVRKRDWNCRGKTYKEIFDRDIKKFDTLTAEDWVSAFNPDGKQTDRFGVNIYKKNKIEKALIANFPH
jgi:hypothetical protein